MTPNPTQLPFGLEEYRRTPTFRATTVPAALTANHSTKAGVWGVIHVEHGSLRYWIIDPQRPDCEVVLTADGMPGLIEPEILHRVEPIGEVSFHVAFHRHSAGE